MLRLPGAMQNPPPEPRTSFLLANNLRIHYLQWNREPGPPTAFCLHDLGSNARIWTPVGGWLAGDGLNICAPDLRGHGRSDRAENGMDPAQLRQDLLAIMQILETERPILIGHGWGAMLALDFAAQFPFGPLAPSGLVLVDGGIPDLRDLEETDWNAIRRELWTATGEGLDQDEFLHSGRFAGPAGQPDDQSIGYILASYDVDSDDRLKPRLVHEDLEMALASLRTFAPDRSLASISCPILVILGDEAVSRGPGEALYHRLMKAGLRKAEQLNPDIRSYQLQRTGHDAPLIRSEELSQRILDFARRF